MSWTFDDSGDNWQEDYLAVQEAWISPCGTLLTIESYDFGRGNTVTLSGPHATEFKAKLDAADFIGFKPSILPAALGLKKLWPE